MAELTALLVDRRSWARLLDDAFTGFLADQSPAETALCGVDDAPSTPAYTIRTAFRGGGKLGSCPGPPQPRVLHKTVKNLVPGNIKILYETHNLELKNSA